MTDTIIYWVGVVHVAAYAFAGTSVLVWWLFCQALEHGGPIALKREVLRQTRIAWRNRHEIQARADAATPDNKLGA